MTVQKNPSTSDYLTTVLDNSTDAYMLFDISNTATGPVFTTVFLNRTAREELNLSTKSIGLQLKDLLMPQYREEIVGHYNRCYETKQPLNWVNKYEGVFEDGSTLYLETKLVPIMNSLGECIQILCISTDVSVSEKYKQATERLLQNSRVYSDVMGRSLIILSPTLNVDFISPELSESFGITVDTSILGYQGFTNLVKTLQKKADKYQVKAGGFDFEMDIFYAKAGDAYVMQCKIV